MAHKQAMEHTTLVVLSLLEKQEMYGYQMIAELEKKFDPTFSMKEGTLYPVLKALENSGAVESYQKAAPTGRMRKYYRITDKGLKQLQEEERQWHAYERSINAVLNMG